jgi:hypothetical protein
MSGNAPRQASPPRLNGQTPARRRPTLGAKLKESWPLFVAGAGCLCLAVALEFQQAGRTLDHWSPTFLFIAVGMTGVLGGVASFIVGPEGSEGEPSARNAVTDPPDSRAEKQPPARRAAPQRENGRPTPQVILPAETVPPAQSPPAVPEWSEDGEDPRIAPALDLPGNADGRPLASNQVWILRVSPEGGLTVRSLEDALRDLDLIKELARANRRARPSSDEDPKTEPTEGSRNGN